MTLKTKNLDFEIKAVDADKGTFTAYGNTFNNVDHAGDMTMKGAFTNTIKAWKAKGKNPRFLSQHGHRANPIGIITSMKEDSHGLLFEGKFCLDTQAGAEAYALVKMGALDQFSIGYNVLKEKHVRGVNELHEIDVKEISLVTFACNENSLIQSIKSALDSGDPVERDVQKLLREQGMSKKVAEAAVNAIKQTKAKEKEQLSFLESFKAKAESHEPKMDLEIKSDMSMGEYAHMICDAVIKSVEGPDVYAYVECIYMDYVVVEKCEYDEDGYKHYYVKIPYSVSPDNEVMVGSSTEVFKDVQWLTQSELDARQMAGVKEEGDNLQVDVKSIDWAKAFGKISG